MLHVVASKSSTLQVNCMHSQYYFVHNYPLPQALLEINALAWVTTQQFVSVHHHHITIVVLIN